MKNIEIYCSVPEEEDEKEAQGLWDLAGELAVIAGLRIGLKFPVYAEDCGQEDIFRKLKELTKPKELNITMSNGNKLRAIENPWDDEYPSEIRVYVVDEQEVIVQDIAIIRPENCGSTNTEVCIYTDENNEDYTHKFNIKENKFKEEQ